jgi:hypothetical protein
LSKGNIITFVSPFNFCEYQFGMLKIVPLFSLLVLISTVSAQDKNQPDHFTYIMGTYSLQIPGGDMAKRFGVSSDIGGGLGYKTKSNWMFGAEATLIFGNKLKEDPLKNILTKDGQMIDKFGSYAPIAENERGLQIKATVGRIIPVKGSNLNSGIFIRGAIGYIEHRINIVNTEGSTPQIDGDYYYGYDRYCNGFSTSEFIGWQQFSNEKAYHFMIGFEFTQGFTECRRAWDFETNTKLTGTRTDLLYTLKMAWFIPIRQRNTTKYFYY